MAKTTLATNFQDDILNSSMGNKRRYNLIQNSDGTVSLEDVSTYDQVGSEYGAGQVNATNKAVNESADAGKIIDDVDDIDAVTKEGYIAGALALKAVNSSLQEQPTFIYDEDGEITGYKTKGGADTVFPFSSRTWTTKIISCSSSSGNKTDHIYTSTFETEVTGKTLYKDLFFYVSNHIGYGGGSEDVIKSASYDPDTGRLTVQGYYSMSQKIQIWYR